MRARVPSSAPALTGALLLVTMGVAVLLRLMEPLTSGLIGGQDPYMHLAHTRSVLDAGSWPVRDRGGIFPRPHYPPGLHALLGAIVATTGLPRYEVARWFPAPLGAVVVLAVFFLALQDVGTRSTRLPEATGAVAAAALAATTPELVFRGNVFIPTALDFLLVPTAALAFLGALRDRATRPAWGVLGAIVVAALLLVHPWAVGLLAMGLAVAVLADAGLTWRVRATALAVPVVVGVAGLAFLLASNYFLVPPERTLARFAAIGADPWGEMLPWPRFVDYPDMLGWPLIVLAGAGAAAVLLARATRTGDARAGAVGLGFTLALVPLTRVDWLGLWYIPHRAVPYAALGLVLLAGAAVTWAVARLPGPRRARTTPLMAVAVVGLVLAAGTSAGLQVTPWYHLYGKADHAAAAHVDAHADVVIVGSWEARWLVRALTDTDWEWYKPFFHDPDARDAFVTDLHEQGYEDIHVLVESGTRVQEEGRRGPAYDLAFLDAPPWERVFADGNVHVYRYRLSEEEGPDEAAPA